MTGVGKKWLPGLTVSMFMLACSVLHSDLTLASEPADTVMRGGFIYTVDATRSRAEALAISADKISFVGNNEDVTAYIGPQTNVIELNGKMVLPGFHDSHIHPISAMLKTQMCNLRGLKGIDAYLEKISQCVADAPNSEWIMGSGWSHAYFSDEKRPDRKLLDAIAGDHPVTLTSYDGHSIWANSKAMELSGIDAGTTDPAVGIIERYPGSQEPIGLFLEDPAMKMISRAMPGYSEDDRFEALMEVQSYLNGLGITSVVDAWVEVENGGVYGTLSAYQRAVAEERLNLRVVAALYWQANKGMEQLDSMKQIRAASGAGNFRADSVKIWQDGVMHTHTAKLLEDYADRAGDRGMSMFEQGQLNKVVTALDKEGFQIHIHADGDGALRESLDALEFAQEINGKRDSRHQIAHLELVHPDDIPRLRDLGVIANVQPLWSTSRYYIGDLINVKLGQKRKRWMEINNSFLQHGVRVAYGSDWFVTSPNPMDLIEAAVTRIRPALPLEEKRTAQAILPGEEVSVADAIASYTINGAFASHQDDVTGSLEAGKLADMIVLDRNLFDVEPVSISETRVLLTFLGGKLVHGQLALKQGKDQQSSRQLHSEFLTGTEPLSAPVATSEFIAGTETALNRFEGILRFSLTKKASHIEVLKDTYKVSRNHSLRISRLPDFSIALLQHGAALIPELRGPQRTGHPYWEYIIEPGRVWQEAADGDWSRVSLPFALKEKNQNCLHNGLLTFLFKSDGSVSRVAYQVGSETCQYLQVNLWGTAKARYNPKKITHASDVIAAWQEEATHRPAVTPLRELATRYPGFDPDKLLPPAASDTTVYGLVVDGVHYRSDCPTRFGPYPYCDVINLPSYSLAKSIFAGLGYMMMVRQWPEFEHMSVSALVPECRLPDGRWDDVTPRDLVNMQTGNYTAADYSTDESSAEMTKFFLAEGHADKLRFSCRAWPRQQAPATHLVYHSTDHYLLGTAMTSFLRQKKGPHADIFRDMIVKYLFRPLKLSQTSRVTQRTYDKAIQPMTAYGLFFRPDDIARLGNFMHYGASHPELFRQQDFATAMFKDTSALKRWHYSRGEAYSLGFWGFDIAPYLPCSSETWIPFMSGYGGIVLALLPNGTSYYYVTDGGHKPWKDAAVEINKISNYCEIL